MKKILTLTIFLVLIVSLGYSQTRSNELDVKRNSKEVLASSTNAQIAATSAVSIVVEDHNVAFYSPTKNIVDTNDGYNVLGSGVTGRWLRKKSAATGELFGTYENACLSWIINDNGVTRPQVLGTSGSGLATYTARDIVGQYIGIYGKAPTGVYGGTGVTYGPTSVTVAGGVSSAGLRAGMIIDTLHTPKYTGTLVSWSSTTLTVDSWWPHTGTGIAATPAAGTGFWINNGAKPFGSNIVVSTVATYSAGACGIEVDVAENRPGTPAGAFGFDAVAVGGAPQIAHYARGPWQIGYACQDASSVAFYNISGTQDAGFRDDSNSTSAFKAQGSHAYFLDFRNPSNSDLSFARMMGQNGYLRVGGNGDPHSTMDVAGSVSTGINKVATDTLVDASVHTYLVTSTANISMYLPDAAGITGRQYVFVQTADSTAGTVTLIASGTQPIIGKNSLITTYAIPASGSVTIASDGAAWYVTNQF